MMIKYYNPIFRNLSFVCYITLIFFTASLHAQYPLLIYYGYTYDVKYFERYKTVVLDPDLYRDVHALRSRSFAYLSIGEINNSRSYFNTVKKYQLLEGKNQEWGSYHIKISDKRWEQLLLNVVIPPIVEGGYSGLFLDTVDSLIARDISNEEIVHLIKAIKKRYPTLKLMLNRGFEIADMVPIDALLYESTISSYDFRSKEFSLFSYDFRFLPKHKIERYSVDYWERDEPHEMAKIYKIALSKGYQPLVTDISLNELPNVRLNVDQSRLEFDK
ncbi:MAG: endo alpha-1,4 polygalactosaminidase [Campylobacterales bacterium]|nr:endo alpha-1,4 polygalactosaminidase [Campylobacterales bacterium]